MAQRRQSNSMPTARIPELLFSVSASVVAFSGAWLWWFGQNIRDRVIRSNDIADPYAVQVWMRRLHSIGTWVLIGTVVVLILRAASRRQGWSMVFLFAFLVFAGVGIWTGYDADWDGARLWSETVGTKLAVGADLGDGPPLPSDLQRARVHLSIIPATLLAVGLLALAQYRRS